MEFFNHFNTITRQKSLNEYTDDLYFINDIALELLDDNFIEGKEYRLLGVGVSNLLTKEEIPTEHNLFNITDKYIKETEINKMIKEFQTKYGDKALYIKKLEK